MFLFNKMNHNFYILFTFIGMLVFFGFAGCSDESDPITPPIDHFDPEGWVIRDATTKPILVVWQGVIQNSWKGVPISDTLIAPLNVLSDHYSIKFLDAQKNIMNAPSGTGQSFNWSIEDTSKLGIVQDSPTDWAFHLKGKQEGVTNLELFVMHSGHVDVRTPKIPVVIKNDTTAYGEPIGIRIQYEGSGIEIGNASESYAAGSLEIKKDSTTDHIEVEFYDEYGNSFQPEFPLHRLSVEIQATGIAEILYEENEPWIIRVKGLNVGSTSLIFKLLVGSSIEFQSAPFPISVT